MRSEALAENVKRVESTLDSIQCQANFFAPSNLVLNIRAEDNFAR